MNKLVAKRASELQSTSPAQSWLIEGLIPCNSIALLAGHAKSKKTWMALEIATAVAAGEQCLKHFSTPKKEKVLIVAGEDNEVALSDRLRGLSHFKLKRLLELDIQVVAGQPFFLDSSDSKEALRAILQDYKPKLLVLDNLSRFLQVTNENNAQQMGRIFEFLKELRDEFGLTVLLVAHLSKSARSVDGARGVRGSGVIDTWYEAGLFLKVKDGDLYLDARFRNQPSFNDVPLHFYSSGCFHVFEVKDGQGPAIESGLIEMDADEDNSRIAS